MEVDYVRVWDTTRGATAPASARAPVATGTPRGRPARSSCAPGVVVRADPALRACAFEWLRDDAAIPGASSPTYVLQVGDARHELGCRVTATNPAGSISAASSTLLIRNRPLTPAAPQLAPALGPSPLGVRAARPRAPRAGDTTAPRATLSTRRSQRLRSSVNVTISCPRENCRAHDPRHRPAPLAVHRPDATARRGSPPRSPRASPSPCGCDSRGAARVTIRRALRARKRMVVQLHVRVADDAGNVAHPHTACATLKL